jgi:excisionase family DNA binding protein
MKTRHADATTPLWSIQEAAAFLGVPVATLYRWRHRGIGPKAYRVGRHLRYDPALIRQWLDTEAA